MGLFDKIMGKKQVPGALVDQIVGMRQQGAPDQAIIQMLQQQGLPMPQVQDAMMQADIKMRVTTPQMGPPQGPPQGMPMMGPPSMPQMGSPGGPPLGHPNLEPQQMGPPMMGPPGMPPGPEMGPPGMPPMGAPPWGQPAAPQATSEDVVEKIVAEKMERIDSKFEDFERAREELYNELHQIKDSISEIKSKYVQLQEDNVVKIEEYNKELEGVGAQIKAMQRVMQNIIPTLAENVRQLGDVVAEMKVETAKRRPGASELSGRSSTMRAEEGTPLVR